MRCQPRRSGSVPSSRAARLRLESTPMATRAPGCLFTLLKSMAGPMRVGRATVPPAPICRYAPHSSATGSASTSVWASSPCWSSSLRAVRRSVISAAVRDMGSSLDTEVGECFSEGLPAPWTPPAGSTAPCTPGAVSPCGKTAVRRWGIFYCDNAGR